MTEIDVSSFTTHPRHIQMTAVICSLASRQEPITDDENVWLERSECHKPEVGVHAFSDQ